MVNRAIAKSTGSPAGKPSVKSLPVSLLLCAVFFQAFTWLRDLHSGMDWDDVAYCYYDCAIPVAIAVVAVLAGIGQKILNLWGEKPPAEFSRVKAKPGLLEILSAIWFFAILLAPLLAWALNIFDRTPSNWRLLLGMRATVTIVLPLVCVLPWLRYVRGRAALLVLAFLAIGTAFPALFGGLESAIDLIRGPEWQTVSVTTFGADELDFVKLSDDRMLGYPEKLLPALRLGGPQRFLVLRASRYILDVR